MSTFSWDRAYMKAHPVQTAGVVLFLAGRYLFSIFFLYGFWHKLVRGWLWTDKMHCFFTNRLTDPPLLNSFQAAYLTFRPADCPADCMDRHHRRAHHRPRPCARTGRQGQCCFRTVHGAELRGRRLLQPHAASLHGLFGPDDAAAFRTLAWTRQKTARKISRLDVVPVGGYC